jgi:hypothetical protein
MRGRSEGCTFINKRLLTGAVCVRWLNPQPEADDELHFMCSDRVGVLDPVIHPIVSRTRRR